MPTQFSFVRRRVWQREVHGNPNSHPEVEAGAEAAAAAEAEGTAEES